MSAMTTQHLDELDALMKGQNRLLIVLHNHPDPDALAGGLALKYLTETRYGLKARIAYSGLIGRAENQALVKELNIPLSRLEIIHPETYDRIAMVDTQPGAGNNSLPAELPCHLIIDHHPKKRGTRARVMWIDEQFGTTATIMIQLLRLADISIPSRLATALSYAVRSETQDLGREASDLDIDAFLSVYPRASMRKLSRISFPSLPRVYFETLGQALSAAQIHRHLLTAYLGPIPIPEIVAEMADLLLRHERITWTLCAGFYQDSLYISMRTSNIRGRAGRLLKTLVPSSNLAGGHDLFAGGRIPVSDSDAAGQAAARLFSRFADKMGYAQADWRPLLNGKAET